MIEKELVIMVVVSILLAGCAGATGGLEIVTYDADRTTFGNIVITATVENTAQEPREALLHCEVRTGGRIYEQNSQITLGSGDRRTFEFDFDIPISHFNEEGEYSCELT